MLYIIRNNANADILAIKTVVCEATGFMPSECETTYDLRTGDSPVTIMADDDDGNPDIALIDVVEKGNPKTVFGLLAWVKLDEDKMKELVEFANRMVSEFYGEAGATEMVEDVALGIDYGGYHFVGHQLRIKSEQAIS